MERALTTAAYSIRFIIWLGGAETKMMDKLWCVHIYGPDSILPTADREEAEQRAAEINRSLPEDSGGVLFKAMAKPWPFTPESHNEAIKKGVDWAIFVRRPTDSDERLRSEGTK
jgi:hypothetical protein